MKRSLIIRVLAVAFSLTLGCTFVARQANKPARHSPDTPRTVLPGSKSPSIGANVDPFDSYTLPAEKETDGKPDSRRELMPSSKSAGMLDPADILAPSPPSPAPNTRTLMPSSKSGILTAPGITFGLVSLRPLMPSSKSGILTAPPQEPKTPPAKSEAAPEAKQP